jgi:hypothetical protein
MPDLNDSSQKIEAGRPARCQSRDRRTYGMIPPLR